MTRLTDGNLLDSVIAEGITIEGMSAEEDGAFLPSTKTPDFDEEAMVITVYSFVMTEWFILMVV